MTNGWIESAPAWIADMADGGDYAGKHIVDAPMLARIRDRKISRALGVGRGRSVSAG